MNAKISILFYAKKAKKSNNGLIPIYMRITVDGKRLEISSKRFVQNDKWNHELSRMKGNSEEARSTNSYLDILKAKVYDVQKEIIQENELVTAETLRCKLLGTEKRARMLLPIFLDHNDKMEKLVGKEFAAGTLGRYRTCLSHIQEFIKWQYRVTDIDELNFSGYFLITWDIVQYSNRRGFMHVGRGSGANSIVSYCLGITDICPLELDLYFERFLNLNRKTPPDFDIDWSWKERDEILKYIFGKYGGDRVAFCGTNSFLYSRSDIHGRVRKPCS